MGNSLPEDKLLMVKKLKENGKVVAFYGWSRASDALTLKEADVGITQDGRCTVMAKAVSDVSLKNRPDPSVIRIRERGKQQYESLQKFFQLQLTAWISGLIIILVLTMHSGESPLSSIHMTWVNLILCLLGGLMMAMELNCDDDRRPSKRTHSLITKTIWINIAIQVCYQVILLLIIFEYSIILGKHASTKRDKDVWETFIFNTFTLCQLINLLNVINLAKKEVFMVVLQSYWFLAASVTVVFFQFIAIQFGKGLLSGSLWIPVGHWQIPETVDDAFPLPTEI
ncbi:hypothetical protein L484_020011 [Morus notabilis]|uniref:Cation-transporting P-type ATPase C-terminal domain-containing protein n=1 Tax=Morus notabilis TaxID=981085 RepID=W9SZT9_9ROSA|nr:hypothetical protein L484_020011 [Morus notabilis]